MNVHPLVVCYSEREKLTDCIASLNAKGLRPAILFQQWCAKLPPGDYISYFTEHNLGCAGARNELYGLRKDFICDTDYVFFIDDDACLVDYDESVLQLDHPIIAGSSVLADGKIERAAIPRTLVTRAHKQGRVFRVTGVCFFAKKWAFERCGGFYNYFPYGYEESDLSLEAFRQGIKILYTPTIKVMHHKPRAGWGAVRMSEHQYAIVRNKMIYINRNFSGAVKPIAKLYWFFRFVARGYAPRKVIALFGCKPNGTLPMPINLRKVLYILLRGQLLVL